MEAQAVYVPDRRRRDATCFHCTARRAAVCWGQYEAPSPTNQPAYACNECCGHACEDGWCEPVCAECGEDEDTCDCQKEGPSDA